ARRRHAQARRDRTRAHRRARVRALRRADHRPRSGERPPHRQAHSRARRRAEDDVDRRLARSHVDLRHRRPHRAPLPRRGPRRRHAGRDPRLRRPSRATIHPRPQRRAHGNPGVLMKSLEAKVGALIVVSLVLLGGFLALLGNFSWRGGTRIRINYDFSGNLQSGAAVKISGIKVGKVEEVRYLGGQVDPDTGKRVQVRVVAFVEDRVKESIRKNAEFFINTQGVLGEQYLEIQPGSWDQPPLDPSHSVEGVNPPRTDLIVARLYEFLDSITGLLRDDKDVIKDFLQSGASVVRTLDDILKTNKAPIGHLLGNVDALSKQAAGLSASIQNGVGDAAQRKATIGNIESISQSIKRDIDP